jgi:hypothetical protein
VRSAFNEIPGGNSEAPERRFGMSPAGSEAEAPSVALSKQDGMIIEHRQTVVNAPADVVFRAFSSLGGQTGWLYMNWVWHFRGWFDRLCGGVGFRKGRRDPDLVRVADAIDFWRVVAVKPGRLIRLRSEMKVPGRVWLQFEVTQLKQGNEKPQRSRLSQTIYFDPCGLFGLLYWHSLYPIHDLIFG